MIRRRRSTIGLWLAMLLLTGSFPAQALTVVPYSFAELVRQAEVIVVATVRGQRGAWDASGQTIHTHVELAAADVIKGDVPAAFFEVRIPGGVVGEDAQAYPGMPTLVTGQRYVLFIHGDRGQFVPFVGAHQGVYRVLFDEDGQSRVLRIDKVERLVVRGVSLPAAPTLEEFVRGIRAGLAGPPPDDTE